MSLDKEKNTQDSNSKLEIANKIASQSKKVAKTYENIEDSFLYKLITVFEIKAGYKKRYDK